MKEMKTFIDKLKFRLQTTKNLEELKQLRSEFFYKSEFLQEIKQQIKTSIPEERKRLGLLVTDYSKIVNKLFKEKKEELENLFFIEEQENPLLLDDEHLNDLKLPKRSGAFHPLTILAFQIEDYFANLGFQYQSGYEVENENFNFNFLNIPPKHPARKMQDTLYLEENNLMLRTHTTNITARMMNEAKVNFLKGYSIGTVFRNDDNDSTHSLQFNQIDFFAIGGFSLANLKSVIDNLLHQVFGQNHEIRYRPSFFPFTEPSYEVDISCFNCHGKGCGFCDYTGWIEILGCGMLHPNVFGATGCDLKEGYGFAAGIGLERLAMLKWSITDIRDFFINDLNFLRLRR